MKGTRQASDQINEIAQQSYAIESFIKNISTAFAVRVVAVHSPDNEKIDVQPLVYQQSASGGKVNHAIIYDVPVMRLFCGNSAVIMRPVVNDIGYCVCATQDISILKKVKNFCLPGSFRRHSMTDAVYLFGIFNPEPTQYIELVGNTINIISPGTVNINAPAINSTGNWHHTGTLTASVDLIANGKSGHNHTHSDPQGGNTGAPN